MGINVPFAPPNVRGTIVRMDPTPSRFRSLPSSSISAPNFARISQARRVKPLPVYPLSHSVWPKAVTTLARQGSEEKSQGGLGRGRAGG